jgi:hypothetical protein
MTLVAEAWNRATLIGAPGLSAACTQGSSQIEASAPLPRPQVVVLQNFAVAPDEVQFDPGISGTIGETMGAKQLPPGPAKAQRGVGLPPSVPTGLVITGQFVSIDQGNQTKRVKLGVGASRSDVRVQVVDVSPRGRTPADEIEVDAKSGFTPGMAETMGAGALAGPTSSHRPWSAVACKWPTNRWARPWWRIPTGPPRVSPSSSPPSSASRAGPTSAFGPARY